MNEEKSVFNETVPFHTGCINIEKDIRSDTINLSDAEEVADVAEIRSLGKINMDILSKEFGKIQTDEIIVTDERLFHIKERHPEDYNCLKNMAWKALQIRI